MTVRYPKYPWSTVTVLAAANDVDFSVPVKRVYEVPHKLRHYLADSSLGHRRFKLERNDTNAPDQAQVGHRAVAPPAPKMAGRGRTRKSPLGVRLNCLTSRDINT